MSKALLNAVGTIPLQLVSALAECLPLRRTLPLPESLIAATSPEGQRLLQHAESTASHAVLARTFEAESRRNFCGVASSVVVLNALGRRVTQDGFFTAAANRVRSREQVMTDGIALAELGRLLAAHGADVRVWPGEALEVKRLRRLIAGNLGRPGDFLLVNYHRQALGQAGTGHISPLAAYNRHADRVLVLDTAARKYPATWVRVPDLRRGIRTVDATSGRMRGIIEVRASNE